MLKKAFTAFLLIPILFVSCSKSSSDPNNNNNNDAPANYLVHTITSVTYNSASGDRTARKLYDFVYDKANNKITVSTDDSTKFGTTKDNIVYAKSGNVVSVSHITGVMEKFFIDPVSTMMDSMWVALGSSKNVFTYTYTFDGKGKVLSHTETAKTYIDGNQTGNVSPVVNNFTWQGDNLVNWTQNGFTFNYAYNEKLAASPDPFTNIYNPRQAEFTTHNEIKTVSYTNNGIVYINAYTYDEKGRIVTIDQAAQNGAKFASTFYTYY